MAYTATAVADWDSTKPAGTETPSVLDDALREIKVCVENDMRTQTQVQNDAAAAIPGLVIRPKFTYSTTSAILIDPGIYHHQGTTEQLVFWDTQLTFTFGSGGSNSDSIDLAVSDWFYLYLDDSAIVTMGANTVLTNSEFVANITEPSWDVTDHAWMNGEDRCIGAFRTDGSSNLLEFNHDGDLFQFADEIADQTVVDIDATFTDINALTIPKFATVAIVKFTITGGIWSWRTNGQTGSTGHIISTNLANVLPERVITDNSGLIELKKSAGGGDTVGCKTQGWEFPIGL